MTPIGNTYFFVGGSGGNFIRAIFGYYQFPEELNRSLCLNLNLETGDCHDSMSPGWQTHEANELKNYRLDNPFIDVIVISFGEDDIANIVNMVFNKSTKFWMIRENIDSTEEEQRNFATIECERFLKELDCSLADFVIDYKTIFGLTDVDLHQMIIDYLGVERLPEVDEFIDRYREINKQYLLP